METKTFIGCIFIICLLLLGGTEAVASTTGESIFQQSCAGCHTIGGGDMVGPDLQGVTDHRNRDWLINYVREAADIKASGDSIALELSEAWSVAMPNTGISKDDAVQVVAHLESSTSAAPAAAPADKEPLPSGDAAIGRNLFVGKLSFRNNGASCLACHDAGGIGNLGGGTLGPDLTNIHTNYGEAALSSVLASTSSPFPTMKPIYDAKPLTEEEVGHLIAYFAATADELPSPGGTQFAMFGAGGALLLLVLSGLIWKERLQGVRKSLVEQSRLKNNN